MISASTQMPLVPSFKMSHEPMNSARDVISAEPRAAWPAHVEVDARERWCHTGIFLEARVLYRFAVPENQTWTDWILVSGPQGRNHFTTSLFRRWLRVQKSHGSAPSSSSERAPRTAWQPRTAWRKVES